MLYIIETADIHGIIYYIIHIYGGNKPQSATNRNITVKPIIYRSVVCVCVSVFMWFDSDIPYIADAIYI